LGGTLFGGFPGISFDNGTHGTFDVQWPDVFSPISGAIGCAKYAGLDTSAGFSAVSYQGYFPSGVRLGMTVVVGFPFEAIYPQSLRVQLLGRILEFFGVISSSEHQESVPTTFSLFQNFPNPFNPTTTIRYDLPRDSFVVIKVFNTLGQVVDRLVNARESAGHHLVRWNASHMPSGVYFYRLETDSWLETRRMLVLK
jgi:hypothetical protein